MPAIPSLNGQLSDGRVSLRLAAERDIPEILIAHQDDPELYLPLGMQRPPSGAELGRRMEEAPGRLAAGTGVTMTIVEPGSDVCLGEVNGHHFDWYHARAELGIWLAPAARRRGLGGGALRLAAAWLFETCGLERLQILTDPGNGAMIAAARAAGFVDEGVLRRYARERGARFDRAVLSLLPAELPRR